MLYTVTNIKYDTDGEKVKLPKKLNINVPDDITDHQEINEYISEEISNVTGYCHEGYCVTPELKY